MWWKRFLLLVVLFVIFKSIALLGCRLFPDSSTSIYFFCGFCAGGFFEIYNNHSRKHDEEDITDNE